MEKKYTATLVEFKTEVLKNSNGTPYRWASVRIDGFSGIFPAKVQGKNLKNVKVGSVYPAFLNTFESEGITMINFDIVVPSNAVKMEDFLSSRITEETEQVEEV